MYDLFEKKDIEEIYNNTYSSVYNYFYYTTLNVQTAEDLTSKTFFRMLEKRHLYDPKKAGIKTWIMAIARNVWIDEYRRNTKIQFVALEEAGERSLQTGQREYQEVEDRLDMEQVLSVLSEKQRQIIMMKYYMGLSSKEIAGIMDLTQSNVSVILSRSIKRLKKMLEGQTCSKKVEMR